MKSCRQGKVKQFDESFKTSKAAVDQNIPLAVIINRGSASASEIVAGAIQDLDRGVVVGQRSYGKGLVQITRPLSYNSQLKVTTAKYYIPSGRCIQALDFSNPNEDGSVNNSRFADLNSGHATVEWSETEEELAPMSRRYPLH